MSEFEDNSNSLIKLKPYLFNRSLSTKPSPSSISRKPSLERSHSIKNLYNSLESMIPSGDSIKGKVKKLCRFFESPKPGNPSITDDLKQESLGKVAKSVALDSRLHDSSIRLPGTEDRIVVYFTSLRGIRRTFEDCYTVRMIFRGFRVWIDERDVSMDAAYRKELQSVLGDRHPSLPHVFIGGKYLGGAEIVKQLHESGELAKIVSGFPGRELGYVCQACGDVRFVPCTNCSGSRKVFEEEEGLLRRCFMCNENGLIRCADCCF